MSSTPPRKPGRHFLQIPGPVPVPDRVLPRDGLSGPRPPRVRSSRVLAKRVLEKVKTIFKTKSDVIIFSGLGLGRLGIGDDEYAEPR